jgi:hypothetical protein
LYSLKLSPNVIVTHLKKAESLFKSCFAISEQGIQLPLAKEFFDFAAVLLGLNKGMNFVECPETCGHYWSENLVWKGLAL